MSSPSAQLASTPEASAALIVPFESAAPEVR
jgi:hypothetical protein